MLQEGLDVIVNIFGSITSVKISSKSYLPIAWSCKVASQIIEIVLGALLLGRDIVPNLIKIKEGSKDYLENPLDYEYAAYAYIAFFALEIILDVTFWIFVVLTRGRDFCVAVSVLLSVFFDLPIMMCGIYLMKAKGTIDWDQKPFELLFQIWYIVNIMLQITLGYAEKVRYWGVIFVAPASYLMACFLYAFVILPITGWHFVALANASGTSKYHENLHNLTSVHGTFNYALTPHMFNFLVISGCVGQWLWLVLGGFIGFLDLSVGLWIMRSACRDQ